MPSELGRCGDDTAAAAAAAAADSRKRWTSELPGPSKNLAKRISPDLSDRPKAANAVPASGVS